ncbi:MAG: hypothetical protein ACR2MX_03310, partial [Cyclobacteriaceae bacterium]
MTDPSIKIMGFVTTSCRLSALSLSRGQAVFKDLVTTDKSFPIKAKLILLVFFVFFLSVRGKSQKLYLDTIYVTYNKSSYLVFNHQFDPNDDFIDISKEEYQSEIKGNTILLKSSAPMVQPTSFTIKNGELFYTGFLAYKLHPPISFYDYRNPDAPKFASNSDSSTLFIESSASLDLRNST